MPQQLLHRTDVVVCFKQVGGPARRGINSGMAQGMATYFLADTDPHKGLRPFDIKGRTVRPYPVLLHAGLKDVPKSLNGRRFVWNFLSHKALQLQIFRSILLP